MPCSPFRGLLHNPMKISHSLHRPCWLLVSCLISTAGYDHVKGEFYRFLRVQGANDPRVPRTEAVQMVETMRRNGSTVWYLEAKDEGHGFRKKANADFQFYATVRFIRQHLLE